MHVQVHAVINPPICRGGLATYQTSPALCNGRAISLHLALESARYQGTGSARYLDSCEPRPEEKIHYSVLSKPIFAPDLCISLACRLSEKIDLVDDVFEQCACMFVSLPKINNEST